MSAQNNNNNNDNERINVVIGIDGGGTKTECALVRVSTLDQLASFTSGPSNKNSVGNDAAKNNLIESMVGAVKTAHDKYPQNTFHLIGICFGMSGVDRPHDKQLVRSWVPDMIQALKSMNGGNLLSVASTDDNEFRVEVYNDAVAAMSSGTLGNLKDSLVIISGTGMIVTGSSDGVNFVRTGGWGPLLGDEGSGYDIGFKILKVCVDYEDGLLGQETVLPSLVKKQLNIENTSQLIDFVYKDTSWNRIAELARLAFEGYAMNDQVSQTIVTNAAKALEKCIRGATQRLNWSADKAFTLVYTGSILTHENSIVGQILSENLKQAFPHITITLPKVSAAVGSALLVAQQQKQ